MGKCKVISHRGSNKIAPQNTLAAFKRSIGYHADGFETDVHLTKDGIPVIHHNYEVDKTSDGKGFISDLTFDELRNFDFGSYFHHSYKNTKIPSLEEFLTLAEKADLEILNIELKSPKNKDYSVADIVIKKVKEHNLFDKLLISSFDEDLLVYVKDVDETCKTGFLYSPNRLHIAPKWLDIVDFAKSIAVEALHPNYLFVNESYVEKAHEAGLYVNPWTVNNVNLMKRLLSYGVDGLITDVPKIALETVNNYFNEQN
ncbi:MAG: glycerophosphodiester phosphodiesterase [Ruminococcus sp.]|nr:glycerophosphodiester phosphodiesterase [Candidatus Copronaster equi]